MLSNALVKYEPFQKSSGLTVLALFYSVFKLYTYITLSWWKQLHTSCQVWQLMQTLEPISMKSSPGSPTTMGCVALWFVVNKIKTIIVKPLHMCSTFNICTLKHCSYHAHHAGSFDSSNPTTLGMDSCGTLPCQPGTAGRPPHTVSLTDNLLHFTLVHAVLFQARNYFQRSSLLKSHHHFLRALPMSNGFAYFQGSHIIYSYQMYSDGNTPWSRWVIIDPWRNKDVARMHPFILSIGCNCRLCVVLGQEGQLLKVSNGAGYPSLYSP